jgi:hypothetical protein
VKHLARKEDIARNIILEDKEERVIGHKADLWPGASGRSLFS